jgi:N-acyl-D-aspartate/D-glutamate deacylase
VHDLVIDNANIIDGSGGPARHGALAVKDGRVAAIGDELGAARERLDAEGLTLAPGIVDIHTHYDAQLTWDPFATPSTALGVTTVVIGNCGFTIAPCYENMVCSMQTVHLSCIKNSTISKQTKPSFHLSLFT